MRFNIGEMLAAIMQTTNFFCCHGWFRLQLINNMRLCGINNLTREKCFFLSNRYFFLQIYVDKEEILYQ